MGRWTGKDHEEIEVHGERRSPSFCAQAEEGTAVAEVCRKAGISEATYYNWRKKYGGSDAVGDEAAEAARGGERQAEEDRRRSVARQGDAAGRHPPKI